MAALQRCEGKGVGGAMWCVVCSGEKKGKDRKGEAVLSFCSAYKYIHNTTRTLRQKSRTDAVVCFFLWVRPELGSGLCMQVVGDRKKVLRLR
jgi:hypothetical protein